MNNNFFFSRVGFGNFEDLKVNSPDTIQTNSPFPVPAFKSVRPNNLKNLCLQVQQILLLSRSKERHNMILGVEFNPSKRQCDLSKFLMANSE